MKTKIILATILAIFSMLFISCAKSHLITVDKVYVFSAGEITMITCKDTFCVDSTGNVFLKKTLAYWNVDLNGSIPRPIPDNISIINKGKVKHGIFAYIIDEKATFVYMMQDGKMKLASFSESESDEFLGETRRLLKPGINVMVE